MIKKERKLFCKRCDKSFKGISGQKICPDCCIPKNHQRKAGGISIAERLFSKIDITKYRFGNNNL